MNQTHIEPDIPQQWLLERAQIESIQLQRLNDLLRHAIQNPFYRDRFEAITLPLRSLEQLTELPLLRKSELVADSSGDPGRLFSLPRESYTRLFIIGIVALTYGLGLLKPPSVFALGVWCFSGFSALFPIVVAALYWRGLTAAGAISGIFAAIVSWSVMFYQALEQDALRTFVLKLPLGGEEYEIMPVVVMLASSLVTMVVVSMVTPKPSEKTLAKFF